MLFGIDETATGDAIAAQPNSKKQASMGERSDLSTYKRRRAQTLDESRTEAVAKRHARGQRTARENIADLVDADSFSEYGSFAVAAQRERRTEEDLIAKTPADGLVCGIASVNGKHFDSDKSRCAVVSYDYMVLAGTQGFINHRKKIGCLNSQSACVYQSCYLPKVAADGPATPMHRASQVWT